MKAAGLAPVARTSEIDWTAARRDRPRIHPSALRDPAPAASSPVPVLLPDDGAMLAAAILTSGPSWYSASITVDRHNVHLTGTRVSFEVPAIPPGSGTPLRVTRNEAIATLTFEAHGASYTMHVECDDPERDPRCTRDDYLLALHARLGVLLE